MTQAALEALRKIRNLNKYLCPQTPHAIQTILKALHVADYRAVVEALERTPKPERLSWLWSNRIPFGEITMFAGLPGVGKTLAASHVIARASTGRGWIDCPNTNAPMDVLLVNPDEGIWPCLMAAGADQDKVIGLEDPAINEDLRSLQDNLRALPDVRLIIIYSVKETPTDWYRALTSLANRHGVAIIVLRDTPPMDVLYGDVDKVRCAWGFAEDQDDGHRSMFPIKAPAGVGIRYTVVSKEVEMNGEMVNVGCVEYSGVTRD